MAITLTKETIENIIRKLNETDSNSELRKYKVYGIYKNGSSEELPLIGDGGIYPLMESQIEWINNGKPKSAFKLDYFANIESPNMLNLLDKFRKYDEKIKLISKQKREMNSLKKLSGVERLIKSVSIDINNAKSRSDMKNILPSLRKLNEIYDSNTETPEIDKKISNLIDKWNREVKKFPKA